MKSSRDGFTLIEICLAVAIALVMIFIAVPSISGVISRKDAKDPFEIFDEMVKKARSVSMAEGRPYFLVWEKDLKSGDRVIVLRPQNPTNPAEGTGIQHIALGSDENYELQLPAAMMKNAPKQWVFWPTGTCEPAKILYKGGKSSWAAFYHPLTVKAEVTDL